MCYVSFYLLFYIFVLFIAKLTRAFIRNKIQYHHLLFNIVMLLRWVMRIIIQIVTYNEKNLFTMYKDVSIDEFCELVSLVKQSSSC